MKLDYVIRSWIENSDTTPEVIGLDEASEYLGYMDNDTLEAIEDIVTAETIRDTWNRLLKEES